MSKAEFQQGFPAENHNYHFEFASVFLYRVNRAAETAERSVRDLDRLSDFEIDFCLDRIIDILVLIAKNPLRLLISDRHGNSFGHGTGCSLLCQETGHARNVVADNILQFRAKLSLDQDITRIKQPFDHLPLAILGYNLTLYRDKYLCDLILQVKPFDLFLKIILGLLFLASSCPKDIPFHVTHGNQKKLQCVNRCHQMLESEVNHEEGQSKNHCGDHNQ